MKKFFVLFFVLLFCFSVFAEKNEGNWFGYLHGVNIDEPVNSFSADRFTLAFMYSLFGSIKVNDLIQQEYNSFRQTYRRIVFEKLKQSYLLALNVKIEKNESVFVGINVPLRNHELTHKNSLELLKKRVPLFEAGFLVNDLYSRADILVPVNEDEWDLIEVKSGTKVKEENLWDVCFQKFVLEKIGLKINDCFLMHVNSNYVKKNKINVNDFFVKENVSIQVNELMNSIEEKINACKKILLSKKKPLVPLGDYCTKPYVCGLKESCWSFLPEKNVFELYRGGKKCFELWNQGIQLIEEINPNTKLTSNQKIQLKCVNENKSYINKEKIKEFIDSLNYPLFFLDFETFNTVIPLYDGLKPYQRIPFQFSLHIQRTPESDLKHYSFLGNPEIDSRKQFMQELKSKLEEKGSIIVFNEAFEKSVLKEQAQLFPEFKEWVEKTNLRIKDLWVPFRKFYYYKNEFQGSFSIKKILPALTKKNYEELNISSGGDASLNYYNLVRKKTPKQEFKKVLKDLEDYCELDTLAMIWILNELKKSI